MAWYLKVQWHHDAPDEPIVLFSEVGADGYEVRKVEVFRDGTLTWADEHHESGQTRLGEVPVGTVDEIASQDDFTPEVITQQEFEEVWLRARA